MLKENVRALERSAQPAAGPNTEYLKNVIIKYLATNDFDVRFSLSLAEAGN